VENLQPVGVGGGRFFYTVGVEHPEVQTMALDVASGQILTGPTAETGPSEGISSGFPAWSSDGRYLAYVHVPMAKSEHQPNLVYRSVSGNNLRQLPIPVEVGYPGWIHWAPDSEGIFVAGGSGTFLVSLTTGEASLVLERGVDRASLSSDGKRLFAPVDDGGVVVYDLETGAETVLYEDDSVQQEMMIVSDMSLAPDGQTLAVGFRAGIALIPASGGELRWVHQTEPGEIRWRGGMGWTPDGQYVVFVKSEALWAVPAAGGEPRKLFSESNLQHVRLHPDGRRVAFVGGPERDELWVMENAPGFASRR
jgi:Tol biopolymer transport system component